MNIIFRNAHIDDLPKIVEIYNSTIASRMVTADTESVSVDSKLDWFYEHNESKRPLWVVACDDAIVGWVSFQDFYGRPAYDGTAEISIYIDAENRTKGIGARCIEHIIASAPALGIHSILGFIFSHNLASIALVKKFNFEEWGHLKDIAILDDRYCSLTIMGRKI
jgi:phosphinothricin acetyltransferase